MQHKIVKEAIDNDLRKLNDLFHEHALSLFFFGHPIRKKERKNQNRQLFMIHVIFVNFSCYEDMPLRL